MQLHPKASHRINMVLFAVLFFALVSQSAGQVYDPETEIYCDGDMVKIPEGMLNKNLDCCGKTVYNRDTSRCCNENILQIPNNISDPYDWECCGEQWQHWQDSYLVRCCKDKFYDTKKQICNAETGEVFDKDENTDLGFCKGEVYNASYQQCGTDGFNTRKEIICEKGEGEFSRSCCGSKPFSRYNELCCIDTVHPYYNTTDGKLLNQCCGRNVFPTPDYFRRTSNYIGKYVCCGDIVIEKSSISEQCCGSIRYNTTDSLCCEGVLVETVSFGDRCCGSSSYNTELSWCCNGNVYPLSFTPQSCYYNYDEPNAILNSESDNMDYKIWVYDRYLSDSKSIFFQRSGPGRRD